MTSVDEGIFLEEVFDHILSISKGECNINEEDLFNLESDEQKLSILSGLKLLHEDLELYKQDYKNKLDAEYKLKSLEKKNMELEQFNFMASHDLKEPLRNIKNFSQLLNNKFETLSSEKIKEYLNYINVATSRMNDLLSSILNYSIAGSELVKTKINLNQLLTDLKADLSQVIEESRAKIEVSELPVVLADKSAIVAIFQNLISNAIKFKSKERDISINITHEKKEDFDIICVADNGLGIQEEYQSNIFKLLKRLHTKSEIEGSGIGLAICRKFIESLGGKIWVESEYGKGSHFYFSLPSS